MMAVSSDNYINKRQTAHDSSDDSSDPLDTLCHTFESCSTAGESPTVPKMEDVDHPNEAAAASSAAAAAANILSETSALAVFAHLPIPAAVIEASALVRDAITAPSAQPQQSQFDDQRLLATIAQTRAGRRRSSNVSSTSSTTYAVHDLANAAETFQHRPALYRNSNSSRSIETTASLGTDLDLDGSSSSDTTARAQATRPGSPTELQEQQQTQTLFSAEATTSEALRVYPSLNPSDVDHKVPFEDVLRPSWHNSAWTQLFPQADLLSKVTLKSAIELARQIALAYKDHCRGGAPDEVKPGGGGKERCTSVLLDHLPYDIAWTLLHMPTPAATNGTSSNVWVLLTVQASHTPPASPSTPVSETGENHLFPSPSSSQDTPMESESDSTFFAESAAPASVPRRPSKRKRDRSQSVEPLVEDAAFSPASASTSPSHTAGLSDSDPLLRVLSQSATGRLTLEHPWHTTSLGAIDTWSPELRSLISLAMQSPFRCALWIGEDLTMIYNDSYIGALGKKHPDGTFGKAGSVAWGEIWDQLGPIALTLFEGKTSYAFDQLFFMEVSGETRISETYYSWSWIPVFDSSGKFLAAVNDAFETTERVLNERRLGTLRDLALTTSQAATVSEFYDKAVEALSRNKYDLPFAMCWSAHLDHKASKTINTSTLAPTTNWNVCNLHLVGTIGVPDDHPSAPSHVSLKLPSAPSYFSSASSTSASSNTLTMAAPEASEIWPFKEALQSRKPIFISDLQGRNEGIEPRGWPDASTTAVVIPILGDNDVEPQAVFVFGLNPRRPWSESEAQFLQLLAKQISTGIDSARSFEEATQKAQALARLDSAKTAFFSNISHELRQPLQLILGPLEDMMQTRKSKDNAEDESTRKSLKMIHRHAQRLLRLVNSLLDFSALEAGRKQPRFRPMDLSSVTTDLASLFRAAIERGQIDYRVDCPPAPALCWIDSEIYEKIVYNILGNAFKYCVEGAISVTLEYGVERVALKISDTGSGIHESELERIFERFYRVENNSSRSAEGTGIGLAMTAELVKIIGGDISVVSELHVGSTFTVSLPLGARHVPKNQLLDQQTEQEFNSMPSRLEYALSIIDEASLWSQPQSGDSSSSSSSGPSSKASSGETSGDTGSSSAPSPVEKMAVVLVCDDNQDMRNFAINVLKRHFVCFGFSSGFDVVAWLKRPGNHADLLISDRMMPHMDGMALLRHVRSDPHTMLLPFIILSARASEEDRIEALQEGADEALGKPISSRELIAKVKNHVQLGQMRIELEKKVVERTQALLEAEVRSRDLAEQLGTVLRMSPCGIFASTSDGVLNYVNEAWHQISGIEGLETVNNWALVVHPEHRAAFMALWNRAIIEQMSISQFEFRWAEDRNGHPAYSQIDMQPQTAPDGSVTFIGALTDTSNIKKLERLHVQEVEQRANDAVKMKQIAELNVDLASHEIRNPLSALYQNGELVGESLERLIHQISACSPRPSGMDVDRFVQELEDDIECLESVVLCATHLRRITDDILGWSKMNVGMLTLSKHDFHFPSQGTAIVKMLEIEAAARHVELGIEIDESVNRLQAAWITADAHRAAQCLINFLTNGIRHTSESTSPVKKVKVVLSAYATCPSKAEKSIRIDDGLEEVEGDRVWVSAAVVDTGHGLGADELNKLFKRLLVQKEPASRSVSGARLGLTFLFTSVQANPARDSLAGYGLGLFVCKKIITLHRGFVEVSSEPGQGSCFQFVIPVERAAPRPLTDEHTGLGSTFGRALRRRRPRQGVERIVKPRTPGDYPDNRDPMLDVKLKAHTDELDGSQTIRVLVVEDNLINQKVLKRQLAQRGFDPEVANNGQEALDILTAPAGQLIRIVLMDLEMPVLGGMAAVAQLRAWEAQHRPTKLPMPVIAVTGNAREEQVQACLEKGFSQVAVKPYRIAELVQQIHDLLQQQQKNVPVSQRVLPS